MQVIVDTNALIRFFTKDIPEKAIKVKLMLENQADIHIPDVVFPELEYVLSNQYNLSRDEMTKKFQFLTSQKNIKASRQLRNAVSIYAISKLDMADCIIAAYSLKGALASFDKELLRVDKVKSFWG